MVIATIVAGSAMRYHQSQGAVKVAQNYPATLGDLQHDAVAGLASSTVSRRWSPELPNAVRQTGDRRWLPR